MAYRFLRLDPLPDYVTDRLNLYKDTKEVSQLGVWIKLTSGAGPIGDQANAGLSIVSNPNIPTFGSQSIHGTLDRNAPIGSRSFTGDPTSYDPMNRTGSGYRPRPIVESVSIKNGSRGLTRTAEFEIVCYSREQADLISKYFLEPGFSVTIEWGWNVSESYHQISKSLKELAKLQDFGNLSKRRFNSEGTYDGYYGLITGGSQNYSDGEYKISVELKGVGEVFSQIQQGNNSTVEEGNEEEEAGDEEVSGQTIALTRQIYDTEKTPFALMYNDLPNKWKTDAVRNLIDNDTVSHHRNYLNFMEETREAFNGETKSRWKITQFLTGKGKVETDEGKTVEIPAGDGIVDDDRYIRFGTLMEIINTGIYNFEEGVKLIDGSRVSMSINTKNIPISAFPSIFSLDASKLYIPNGNLPDFGLRISFDAETENTAIFSEYARNNNINSRGTPNINSQFNHPDLPDKHAFPYQGNIGDVLDTSIYSERKLHWGFLDDLYINFDFAVSVLEKKGSTIREVMLDMLNGMSSAVNNIWDFQISEDTDENDITIVSVQDWNFTGFKQAEIPSLVSVGTESSFESFSLDIDIPGAMMNQIISRRLSESKPDYQSEASLLPNRLFGDGITFEDYIMKELPKKEVVKPKPEDPEPEPPTKDELITRNFEFFQKRATIIPTITSPRSPAFTSTHAPNKYTITPEGQLISDINSLDFVVVGAFQDDKLFNHLRVKGEGSSTEQGLSPLLPIKTNWSTFGISGLRNGLTYKISDLPDKYRDGGLFQVTEVTHTVSGMKWTTSIEGQFRQSSK